MVIPYDSLNMVLSLNWANCSQLAEVIIGDNCFMNVNQFVLDGLDSLQSIQVGYKSFTQQMDVEESDSVSSNLSRSFSVTNCKQLGSIQIGCYSFSDYSGDFKLASSLRRLP